MQVFAVHFSPIACFLLLFEPFFQQRMSKVSGPSIVMLPDVSKCVFLKIQCGKRYCGRPTPRWSDGIFHLAWKRAPGAARKDKEE